MGAYILCQNPRATQPYFIENIQTNIYSLEELCYYIYNNVYLVDETIMSEPLFSWISNELRLPSLAAKLRLNKGKFAQVEEFAYPVFKEINYLTYEELKVFGQILSEYAALPLKLVKKRKADSFMRNGMVVKAISIYEALLDASDPMPDAGPEQEAWQMQRGAVFYNLGCAYSQLFQMEKAAECFRQAADLTGQEEDMAAYLLACRMTNQPQAFEEKMKSLSPDSHLRALIEAGVARVEALPAVVIAEGTEDEALDRLMQEYHRCMTP